MDSNNIEEWTGMIPRIDPGEDFYIAVEKKISLRLRHRRRLRDRVSSSANVVLIILTVALNALTIGISYEYLTVSADEEINNGQIYYYDPAQYQVAGILNHEP